MSSRGLEGGDSGVEFGGLSPYCRYPPIVGGLSPNYYVRHKRVCPHAAIGAKRNRLAKEAVSTINVSLGLDNNALVNIQVEALDRRSSFERASALRKLDEHGATIHL